MCNRTPRVSTSHVPDGRRPVATLNENYKSLAISWRIGKIDFDFEWGWKAILGEVDFNYSETILEQVLLSENEQLDSTLRTLDGRSFGDLHEFMTALHRDLPFPIPNNVTCAIIKEFAHRFFWDKILPKIQTIELSSWHDIEAATHGKGKSNSHFISVGDLKREARNRLKEIGYAEYDEIYSLRLVSANFRIYGFREFNCLNIIWIDPNHDAYQF